MSIQAYYSGRTVVITGASSGIGEAMARQLAVWGARLVLVARRVDRLEALAQSLRQPAGPEVSVVAWDLSLSGSARGLYQRLETEGLLPDILINNAGFGEYLDFCDHELAALEEMIRLNVETLTVLSRLCLPRMRAQGAGGILNVSSVVAYIPVPGFSAYSASKAYVYWLTQALSHELAGTGVHVSVLCPGPTTTEFHIRSHTGGMSPAWGYASATSVARQGLRALARGRVVQVTGLVSYPQVIAAALLPRRFLAWISGRVMATARALAISRKQG